MAILRIEQGEKAPSEVELGEAELKIGRGADNGLPFKNPWLSRLHARVFRYRDRHYLEDLGSRNGTFLNGGRLTSTTALHHGDSIRLGDIELRYFDARPAAFEDRETHLPLTSESTVILTADELEFGRYREGVARAEESLLPALNAAAGALISHYPLDELIELIMNLLVEAVGAERGALLLRPRGGKGELRVRSMRGFSAGPEVRISRTIVGEVVDGKKAILTLDAQTDERFDGSLSIQLEGIRSLICVPLWGGREVIGLVYLDQRAAGRRFSSRDLRLVGLIANMAAVKIENAYLLEEQLEKRRMEEQLAVGAKIQRALLPSECPRLEGYDIVGAMDPCHEVGGDYYDFIRRQDGKLALVIADVSGKGVGAALLMASLQASLKTLLSTAVEPPLLVAQLNRALVANSPDNKFASLFYAELDPKTHVLEYVSGGHNPGLLLTGGGLEELPPSGPVVGLDSEARFASRKVELPPGSTLLLYTDGVTELMTPSHEEFGTGRLREVLERDDSGTAEGLIAAIQARMAAFAEDGFDDDSTLVVVRRATGSSPNGQKAPGRRPD